MNLAKMPVRTYGADPEAFVMSPDGHIIPACGLFGGTKTEQIAVIDGQFEIGKYLEDNVTLEVNVEPQTTPYDTYLMTWSLFEIIRAQKKKIVRAFDFSASYMFNKAALTHPGAITFGCDPDRDAYTGQERAIFDPELFNAPEDKNFAWRFAGGHMHIGIDPWPKTPDGSPLPKDIFIKFLDAFAYYPNLHFDIQGLRRQFYGKPGLWRDKPYGVEYRTPSNFWVNRRSGNNAPINWTTHLKSCVDRLSYPDFASRWVGIYHNIDWETLQKHILQEYSGYTRRDSAIGPDAKGEYDAMGQELEHLVQQAEDERREREGLPARDRPMPRLRREELLDLDDFDDDPPIAEEPGES